MERIANDILDVAGHSVAKAVKYAKEQGKPLLLMPETFFVDPLSPRKHRLVVYAVSEDDAFLMKQRMKELTDNWLYTDHAYLVYPTGKVFTVRLYHSDAVDP